MNDFGVNGLTKEQVLAMTPNDNGQFRVISAPSRKPASAAPVSISATASASETA